MREEGNEQSGVVLFSQQATGDRDRVTQTSLTSECLCVCADIQEESVCVGGRARVYVCMGGWVCDERCRVSSSA